MKLLISSDYCTLGRIEYINLKSKINSNYVLLLPGIGRGYFFSFCLAHTEHGKKDVSLFPPYRFACSGATRKSNSS